MSYASILLALYGIVALLATTPFIILGWRRRNDPYVYEPEELEALEHAAELRRFDEARAQLRAQADMEREVEIVGRARQAGIDPHGIMCNSIRQANRELDAQFGKQWGL